MQVAPHPETGQLLMLFTAAPEHESILQRIARRVRDHQWVTVFRMETVNILKRMGYAPPDVFEHYQMRGKYTPYAHQRATTKFLIDTYRGWCLNGMRSGKTSSTVWACDALIQFGEVKRVLVLAPLSIMDTSWAREFFYANPQLRVYVANRGVAKMIADCEKSMPQVLIMNHDKLRHVGNWTHEVFGPDVVVLDEATGFKDADSDRYQYLELIMSAKRRLWLLTGTPCPNSPEDVWGLSRLVNPATPNTIAEWRNRTMTKGYGSKKLIPLAGADKEVADLLYPSIRFRTEDCIDMPPQTYHDVVVTLTPEQSKAYKEMLKHMATDYNSQRIVAANAAVRIFKLLQIAAGIVLDNDGNPVVIGAKPRVAECKRLIEQAEGKVIIISPFTEVQKYIVENLSKHFTCALVNGTITGTSRTKVFDDFQNPDGARVLVAHPEVIQFGLTLSQASMSIWWTGTFSTLHFSQANERMRGPDTHKTGVYMMQATALERRVFRQVQTNSMHNENIVDMYREIMDNPGDSL